MTMNADGSGLELLTYGIDPALSPDGQTVAFTRWQGKTGSVWLIGLDGSNERQILDFTKQAKGPAWSPDGSQLVINFQQGGRLKDKRRCVDATGGVRPPRNAFDIEGGLRQTSDGDFEPYICWTLPPDPYWNLRVVNLADGTFEDLDGGTYAFRPAWDPGQPWRIVSDGGLGLVEVDLNRKAEQPITNNVNDGSPVFSPDGRFIAVTAGQQGRGAGYDIYRLNADGAGRVRLTQTPLWVPVQPEEQKQWNNVAPAWSPDGSQIAFLTDRTGRWEIWLMNADGSNQRPMFSEEINNQLNITYNFVDERVISWQ
jgi:Tol biopolymer transport system component